jgi:hypothetical protein
VFEFAIRTVDRPTLLVGDARGELAGTGTWRVFESPLGTASTWEWQVATTRQWMNAAGPLARPVLAWTTIGSCAEAARERRAGSAAGCSRRARR